MKSNGQKHIYSDWEKEVAKRIYCSTMSVQLRITFQTYWKSYMDEIHSGEAELGVFWLEIARVIKETFTGKTN